MLKEIFPSLYWLCVETRAEQTPFTYLLRRSAGNILFGTKEDVSSFAGEIELMGGIKAVFLGDRHHASAHSVDFAKSIGATLIASDIEAKALQASGVEVGEALPHERQSFADDLEILPTPGHTRGAFSYLWTSKKKRYLFVGDTLVPRDDEWEYYVTRPNRDEMMRTVQMLTTVTVDVVLSNSFAATPVAWHEVTARSWSRILKSCQPHH